MSIISSKQSKKHSLGDWLLAFLALTLVLLMLVPSAGNVYNPIRIAPGTLNSMRADMPINRNVSFAADQQYWDANCNYGWSSDAGCDSIVARSQSCSISIASTYCSEYESYLQQYRDK